MDILKKRITIPTSIIVLSVFVVISIFLIYFYANSDINNKWAPLIGGALVASISSLIHYSLTIFDLRKNEKLNDSGVIKFLESRDDRDYYGKLIKNTKNELNLLFYTSKRFCEDFCTNGGKDNLLISTMENNPNLIVKLLILDKSHINGGDQHNFEIADVKLKVMQDKFGDRFQVKYYDHIPTHNIFLSEKDAIVGPYFYNANGKFSHSIHFRASAKFIKEYKEYFDAEWAKY
ncbi:hypothetical protein [Shewanella frigidimarina]|uniref:Uncharacterized protein n=1 Tax=Shewanella frigidimarina (strain NCIMB 400) TaxID=318167 RepID=Q07YD6_SHEFN|nr:hypothetical protein [Shewanella frigidimarina]ABI72978.1 hypothetical protein Sfri_3141 [Shewanella frigidimarina NCIMB 400]